MNKIFKRILYRAVFNRCSRLNRDGKGLIQIECIKENRRIYFSTHIYVEPSQFQHGRIINHQLANEHGEVNKDTISKDLKKILKKIKKNNQG